MSIVRIAPVWTLYKYSQGNELQLSTHAALADALSALLEYKTAHPRAWVYVKPTGELWTIRA